MVLRVLARHMHNKMIYFNLELCVTSFFCKFLCQHQAYFQFPYPYPYVITSQKLPPPIRDYLYPVRVIELQSIYKVFYTQYTFSIYNHIYAFEYICMQLKLHAINSLPERRLRRDLSSSWKDPLWFDSHKWQPSISNH